MILEVGDDSSSSSSFLGMVMLSLAVKLERERVVYFLLLSFGVDVD